VIDISPSYSGFTIASTTAFQHSVVRFINISVAKADKRLYFGNGYFGTAAIVSVLLLRKLGNGPVTQVSMQLQVEATHTE